MWEGSLKMARAKKLPPLHPGEVLYEDFVVPTGISIHRLAMDLRVPANRMAEIVKGQRAISADTALRLARYLGTSAEFWLGLQSDYDLEKAKDELAHKIEREVRPRKRAA
jgi:addiction module HigA family antidote